MDIHLWFTYVLACCVITFSPGNGAVLCMQHGLSYGVRHTTPTILGLQAGIWLVMAAAFTGVSSILLASEKAFWLLKLVGGGYLLYLGWKQWHSSGLIELAAASSPQSNARPSLLARFIQGFLTNASNPKGIVFMVAVLPQFIEPGRHVLLQFLILACTLSVIDLCVMHGYAWLARGAQRWVHHVRAIRWQQRGLGGLLMCAGIGILFYEKAGRAT
jgi:homoserine/homoserine lactone efflux protein